MTEEKSNDSLNEFDDLLDVKKTDLKAKEYSEVETVKADGNELSNTMTSIDYEGIEKHNSGSASIAEESEKKDPPDLPENTGFFKKIWNNIQSFSQNLKSVRYSGFTENYKSSIDETVSNVKLVESLKKYKNSNKEPELEFVDLAEEEIDKLIAEIENYDSLVTTENEEVSLEISDVDEVAEEVVDVIIADFEDSDNTEETIIIEQAKNGNNEQDIADEKVCEALSGEVIEDVFIINDDEVDEIIENFDFSDISEEFK